MVEIQRLLKSAIFFLKSTSLQKLQQSLGVNSTSLQKLQQILEGR
jgi:hypothetical protein